MTTDALHSPPPAARPRVLRRCPHRRVLAGVAAGLADYLDVDPNAVRIALVVFAFVGGLAVPLYLAAWLLIPDEEAGVSILEALFSRPERY